MKRPAIRTLAIAALALAFTNSHAQEPAPVAGGADPGAPDSQPSPPTPPTEEITTETIPLVIEARGIKRTPAPLFFSASSNTSVTLGAKGWSSETQLDLKTLQGKSDVLTLELFGDGDITAVTGEGVAAWAVGQKTEGKVTRRFLEIRPAKDDKGVAPKAIKALVKARESFDTIPGQAKILSFGSGDAVGFTAILTVTADTSVDVKIASAAGLLPVDSGAAANRIWKFQSFGQGQLALALTPGGAAPAPVEITGAKLTGTIDESGRSASFVLEGTARVNAEDGGRLDILSGHAAVSELPAGNGFSLRLDPREGCPVYQLVFDKAGDFPVSFAFQAGLNESNGRYLLDFKAPAGAVVPVGLVGLPAGQKFDAGCAVFPLQQDGSWVGFLPGDGRCQIAWQKQGADDEGKLFFASDALVEVRVSAGLLRQTTTLSLNVLQGRLDGAKILLEGDGEILAVEGGNVLGWSVAEADGVRSLVIETAQPATGTEQITVRSQTPLGDFPLDVSPLRLTPEGAVRHSGHLRVANSGAVRLEVGSVKGLTQLAPEQFPGGGSAGDARQVFVYRFPSAQHSYQIHADQILPEIGISQILIYEMTETDRVIGGRVELDIREAPLREWEMRIPDGFAVVSVTGAEVADYIAGSEVDEVSRSRSLKILFKGPVSGRQLVQFRLERNVAAQAGPWVLPKLSFPGAKTVRGHVGVAAAPGYRVTPGPLENLVEVPMAYFPAKVEGLQQTFRLREADWSASFEVAALPQSVQADIFHLYSLKEGIAYGSVLVNYFVVGAPVSEWRLEVPEAIGNLAVEGQNVQGWRRDDESSHVVVTLHQPTLGAATLLLTFEQPMDVRGGLLKPGEVKPVAVAAERGFIQVVSPSQVRLEVGKASPGLLKMEALELPAEFRLLSNSPSLAAYQYSARPFELELNLEWFTPGDTINQIVDFARLESRVSGDGEVVTSAKFYVRTRGRKALRMRLPDDAILWETRVNNAPVNARSDGAYTLVPLPASIDPNTPVEVAVQLGQTADNPRRPKVGAPALSSPTLVAAWTIKGDPDRRIAPAGRSPLQLVEQVQTETGFEWLAGHASGNLFLLALAAVAGIALVRLGGSLSIMRIAGIVLLVVAAVMAFNHSGVASRERTSGRSTLEFAAPVVAAGESLSVELHNVAAWQTFVSWPGVLFAIVGLACLVGIPFAPKQYRRWMAAAGIAVIGGGLLAQRGGAVVFFIAVGVFLALVALAPAICDSIRAYRLVREKIAAKREAAKKAKKKKAAKKKKRAAKKDADPDAPSPGGATPLALLFGIAAFGLTGLTPQPAIAANPSPPLLADSLAQTLRIEDGRLYGEVELQVSGQESDTLLFLSGPAILTKFAGDGLRVSKRAVDGRVDYWLVVEKTGTLKATAAYELVLADPPKSFTLPTAAAAVQRVDVRYGKPGWEMVSPSAVRTEPLPGLPEGASGARMTLGPQGNATINLRPKSRDIAAEKAEFFAEIANLFVPGPGLVDGRHKITVRPARGQIRSLDFSVPEGFTVSDVTAGAVSDWRFDPEAKTLRVQLSPAQSKPFALSVSTQQGTGALPATSSLSPLGINGAVRQIGMIAIAFGNDAQPEKIEPTGLSKVNLDDFDASLLPVKEDGTPLAVLHQAFRYGAEPGSLSVTVGAVQPEVRVTTQQTLSMGSERLVLAVDLVADITRAGLFKLSFPLAEGLEVEAASSPALSHWTESTQDGTRIITLHLNGRTLGAQQFAISLTAPAPGEQRAWAVPRFSIREATRQTGQLLVVPEQGIQADATSRKHVSQLDARKLSGGQPGTLAFRLLQADWELKLGLESLETWVTAQALHEVTLREGLTRTRLSIDYLVENASVNTLRLRLPGLTPEEEKTVRAGGDAVTDIVKVEPPAESEEPAPTDLWEIRFSRRILGRVMLEIDFQRTAERQGAGSGDGEQEPVQIAILDGVRQTAYWVAGRVSGHLDLSVGEIGRGWQRVDWSAVPRGLQDPRDRSMPAFAFRAVDPEGPLQVKIQRHAVAEALSMRVSRGNFTTVFAPDGAAVTEAVMLVELDQKSPMEIRLPSGATLLGAVVNEESVDVVTEGDAYRFYVHPREEHGDAQVSVSWSLAGDGKPGRSVDINGPQLNVPLQNITWEVILPEGYTLLRADGSLDLAEERGYSHYDFETYRRSVLDRRQVLVRDGQASLEKGIEWRGKGDQGKALSELGRATRNPALAPSTNEDARVQLRELQTEQAVVGLNTRRQKLYLDNAGEATVTQNQQLEQAAERNPLLQGRLNYNPQEVDNLLRGNTSEENTALKRIASRIVGQQLAAEPARQAIDVRVQGRGEVLTFKRSVQVDGGAPLEIELKVAPERHSSPGLALLVLLILAALGTLCFWNKSEVLSD